MRSDPDTVMHPINNFDVSQTTTKPQSAGLETETNVAVELLFRLYYTCNHNRKKGREWKRAPARNATTDTGSDDG